MTVYKKHTCDSCGFTWAPKGKKPTFCPNCGSKRIGLSSLNKELGIDSLD